MIGEVVQFAPNSGSDAGPTPWRDFGLSLTAQGTPHPNADNVARILRRHAYYAQRVWFDSFHFRIRTDYDVGSPERAWSDGDDIALLVWIQGTMQIPRATLAHVQQGVLSVANADVRREPNTWLEGLEWDGFRRLDGLAVLGFGANDTDYSRAVGANLIKSLCARMSRPGCKVDTMPILESPQGAGKTRALQVLADPWYGELHSQFGTKDAIQELQGKALLEVAELDSMGSRQVESIKAWLSRVVDTYRPSYGRHAIDVPRSCVFVGSTNEQSYLRDSTGARRFWPVRCGVINLRWLRDNRDQLFAEAYARLRHETWWDVPHEQAALEQEARFDADPWAEPIESWLVGRDAVTTFEVLRDAIFMETPRQDKAAQMRVGKILARLGWIKRLSTTGRLRIWMRGTP